MKNRALIKGEKLGKKELGHIESLQKKPRQGWDTAFKLMRKRGEDKLLIDDTID